MEEELRVFKKEVERRYEKSSLPKDYRFPRPVLNRAVSGEVHDWEVSERNPIAEPELSQTMKEELPVELKKERTKSQE